MSRLYVLLLLSLPLATLPVLAADTDETPAVEATADRAHRDGVPAPLPHDAALVGSMEADDLLDDAVADRIEKAS